MKRYLIQHFRGRQPWPRTGTPRVRPALELLEARNLPDSGLANVLVNDPALDTTAQDTQSETAIVLGAGSKVIVAYNDSVGMVAGDNYHGVGISRSADGGTTFEEEGRLPVNPHHDQGDPVLARSAKTGTVFLSTIGVDNVTTNPNPPPPLQWSGKEQVNVYRSTNNGATFEQPVNGTPGFDPNVDVQDKPWIAVDNFPGTGYGNVYLVNYHVSGPAPNFHFDIHLTRSTDDGLTWGPSGGTTITSTDQSLVIQGPNVTVGPDHAVYVFWWDQTKGVYNSFNAQLLMRKSTDQGVTFGDPVTVTTLQNPHYNGNLLLTDSSGHYFDTNTFPQAVVNPVTGDIYVAYNDWGNGKGTDKGNIYFTESTDGGQKWSKPVQVNDDLTNNDQWFPALAVTPDGSHVGLFWYDRRNDPADNLIGRYGAIGTVSGHAVSFGANFRVTDASFPPVFTYFNPDGSVHTQDPVIRPGYMGDYDQAVADNDYFYTTWGDNRLADAFHTNQPDARFAKVPVGWAGTVSALAALASPAGALASHPAMANSTPFAVLSGATTVAVTDPGALPSGEVWWQGLAVDVYFMDLARTNQAIRSVPSNDPAHQPVFDPAPASLPRAADPVAASLAPAPVAPTLWGGHGTTDEWATDVLISADLWWDGEDVSRPAR